MKQLALALRGGKVDRYHTIAGVRQSVGEHTFGVCQVLHYITYGRCSVQLLMSALNHDIAEYETGDMPHYVKVRNPGLKRIMDELEEQTLYDFNVRVYPLSEKEHRQLKLADLCEMGLYGVHLYKLGNGQCELVLRNVLDALDKLEIVSKDKERVGEIYNLIRSTYQELSRTNDLRYTYNF